MRAAEAGVATLPPPDNVHYVDKHSVLWQPVLQFCGSRCCKISRLKVLNVNNLRHQTSLLEEGLEPSRDLSSLQNRRILRHFATAPPDSPPFLLQKLLQETRLVRIIQVTAFCHLEGERCQSRS